MGVSTKRSQIVRDAVDALGPTCTAQEIRDWGKKNRGDGLAGYEFSAQASNCRRDTAAKLKVASNGAAAHHMPTGTVKPAPAPAPQEIAPPAYRISPAALVVLVRQTITEAGGKESLKALIDVL